jgi:hypothetical protein
MFLRAEAASLLHIPWMLLQTSRQPQMATANMGTVLLGIIFKEIQAFRIPSIIKCKKL